MKKIVVTINKPDNNIESITFNTDDQSVVENTMTYLDYGCSDYTLSFAK
jgi:hypothetical protein